MDLRDKILHDLLHDCPVSEICSDWDVSPETVRNIWEEYLSSKGSA